MNILKLFKLLIIAFIMQSCTTYSTDLNELQKIKVSDLNEIKRGEACAHNLFGAFVLSISFSYVLFIVLTEHE